MNTPTTILSSRYMNNIEYACMEFMVLYEYTSCTIPSIYCSKYFLHTFKHKYQCHYLIFTKKKMSFFDGKRLNITPFFFYHYLVLFKKVNNNGDHYTQFCFVFFGWIYWVFTTYDDVYMCWYIWDSIDIYILIYMGFTQNPDYIIRKLTISKILTMGVFGNNSSGGSF